MCPPLDPEESLDSIIEEMPSAKTSWITDFPQLYSHHDFLKVVHDNLSLLPTIFTYEPFMVRIIACNNVCNFCVNIADFCQFMNNSWIFFSRSNWREIKDSCVALRKDICSSCKGSCLGIRFILCSIPSFYWWTLFENHQKCLIWIFMPKLYFADIYFGGIRVQLRKKS